jgi:hypothetical protein
MSFDNSVLEAAEAHTINHRPEIERSTVCGCLYCQTTFAPGEIWRWLAEGTGTALCPECQIDSVVGDASGLPVSDPRFLKEVHDLYYGGSVG